MVVDNEKISVIDSNIGHILKNPLSHSKSSEYLEKKKAIDTLNLLLTNNAYSSNVRMVYFQFWHNEYVALVVNDLKLYKDLISCVTADSIPTMIKEAINDLLPYF